MSKNIFVLAAIILAFGLMCSTPVRAVTTTPTILNYHGILKDSLGAPVITAQSFRFSIWNDSDYDAPADFDGAGSIPPGAPGYSGYQEVQTVTPDANGFFEIQVGSVTPIPDFNITTHLFLQVEIKPSASSNTTYEELDVDGLSNTTDRQPIGTSPYANNSDFIDNREIGTGDGDIAILGVGGVFNTTVIPGGTAADSFVIDTDDSGGDITLQFGTTLGEALTWNSTTLEFDLSDDLNINGGVTASGTVILNGSLTSNGPITLGDGGDTVTINSSTWDISGAGVATGFTGITSTGPINFSSASSFTTPQGVTDPATCSIGQIFFNTTSKGLKVCTATNTWNSVDLDKAETVTVAKSGANFTTINAAVSSITDATAIKPYVINVYPGVYAEAPITLPDFVSILGNGTVIVVATSPTGTLINSGNGSRVDSLVLQGASGVGGICYRSSTLSLISNVQFRSCATGFLATGSAANVSGLNLSAFTGAFTDFIRVEGGATFSGNTFAVKTTGLVGKGVNVIDPGTSVEISNYAVLAPAVTDGAYVDNGATLSLLNATIRGTVNGIHVGPTGTSLLRGTGGIVENNSQYSLYVESPAAKIYFASLQTQKENFNVNPNAQTSITFNNTTTGEEGTNIFGRLSVGRPESSSDSFFGQGDTYTNGMLVYTFNGVSYANVSTAARDTTSTFSFPTNASGNAIYVSADRQSAGDYLKFGGIQYLMGSTASNPGAGQIVHEYWNGSAWVTFMTNCVNSTLHYDYDGHCFERPDTTESDNFDFLMLDNWIKNDPASLGTNRFWIRLRIVSGLTVAPVFQQFKIHTDAVKINSNGDVEFLGEARFHRPLIDGLGAFVGAGSNAPSNVAFSVGASSTFNQDFRQASFRGDGLNLNEITSTFTLPQGLDTSTPLEVIVYWKKTNDDAGEVKWEIDAAPAGVENVQITDGSNVATAPRPSGENTDSIGVQTIETIADGNSNTSKQVIGSAFSNNIDVSRYYSGDQMFLRLYRDAADPDDTYDSDAAIVGFRVNGVFRKLGGEAEDLN